jgi:uncharacterized protein (TIRG00374 family)
MDLCFIVLLSLGYYFLKSVRFWYLLRAMDIRQPFDRVAWSYMSAQPISLLPGGEIYRSNALERFTGVPVRDSIPQFTLQGLLEGASMACLAVISALALHTFRTPFLALLCLMILGAVAIRRGHVADVTRWLNRLPKVNFAVKNIEDINRKHQAALSRPWLPALFIMSILIELIGTAIAFIAVQAVGGEINGFQAILLYIIPIIVGFFSLLPGGLGISEQSAVGILLLSKVTTAQAVAATLLMRVAIVGLGVLYGWLALLYASNKFPQKAKTL